MEVFIVMDMAGFDEYVSSLNCRITRDGAKWKMLRALYEKEGNYISSDKMMEISGNQPEFARRLRELRDNCGANLEAVNSRWRLIDRNILESTEREYLTASQKKKLFETANYCCQICGDGPMKPGSRGLQADHRIPVISGGSSKFPDNWMALCWLCNIIKRRMVQGWKGEWESCPWAFPEKFDVILQVPISNNTFEKLRNEGHTTESISKILGEFIEKDLA
jgi:5-methylcytosine-specific restriction endonuclease McrA